MATVPLGGKVIEHGAQCGEVGATAFRVALHRRHAHQSAEHDLREARDLLDEGPDDARDDTRLALLLTDVHFDEDPGRPFGPPRDLLREGDGVEAVDEADLGEDPPNLAALEVADEVEEERVPDHGALRQEVLEAVLPHHADPGLHERRRLAGSGGGARERDELLELVGLVEARDRRVEEMSKGMQQRLGIAQAMVGRPGILLLDEPTSALDPAGRRAVRELLQELRRRGTAVLLNSHLLSEVELVCDRVAIVARGRVVAAGSPGELARPGGVEVETAEGTRTFAGATREDVPRIVSGLVAAGERIYAVRSVRPSLEDVYLEAVGDGAAARARASGAAAP